MQKVFWLLLFSVAMGFLEAAVVIYLRDLYYPDGFQFPLMELSSTLAMVELLREAATVIMLLSLAMLAGTTLEERLGYFLASFAVWDVFYYVFLKGFLDWPLSWFTWDILFLIPVPWIGPVISPVIVSITMILLAIVLIYPLNVQIQRLKWVEWILLIVGSLFIILSWTLDFMRFGSGYTDIQEALLNYTPTSYPWLIFVIGESLISTGILLSWRRVQAVRTLF